MKRLSQRLNEIMIYGVNSALIFANPLNGTRAVFKKPKKENMAALPPEELPELMMEIANASVKRTTRCLIEWQLHTMTRPAEAATARWADIDFDKRIWTIPPERMKKRRPHTIEVTSKKASEPSDRRDQRSLGRRVWRKKQNLKRQIQSQASRLVDWDVAASRPMTSACCNRSRKPASNAS